MGRHSFEAIGRPLPNRTTIVVSTSKNFDAENCMMAKSLSEAINMAGDRDVYISGGARLYEETLEIVDKMYVERMTAYVKKVNAMVEKKKQNKK